MDATVAQAKQMGKLVDSMGLRGIHLYFKSLCYILAIMGNP